MMARSLRWRTTGNIIIEVAALFGEVLTAADLDAFLDFETHFNSTAFGRSSQRSRRRIATILRLPQQPVRFLLWADSQLAALRFYGSKARRLLNRLYHDRVKPAP